MNNIYIIIVYIYIYICVCVYVCVCVCVCVCCKLAIMVEGKPKATFSIATTLGCREECHSFSWIAPIFP